jgi:hypothetical protein
MSAEKHVTWVSPRKFSVEVRVPISTVYRWIRSGQIHHFRHRTTGRLWIHWDEIEHWQEGGSKRPRGALPASRRDDWGDPLSGKAMVELGMCTVPHRRELLFGTAAQNLERSIAIYNHDYRVEVEIVDARGVHHHLEH